MNTTISPILDRQWLISIANQIVTPAYVYSISRLRRRIAELRSVLPNVGCRLFFATMANDEPEILRTISAESVGACVNSLRHWTLAQQCGFESSAIQFTSSGIPIELMRKLADAQIACNLDSELQVEQWFAIGGREVGLRLNCGAVANLAEEDSDRLGMDKDSALRIVKLCGQERPVVGVHMYAGTNFLNAVELVRRLSCLFDFAAKVPSLRYVNIGGGIGIDYTRDRGEFDLSYFGNQIGILADRLRRKLHRNIEVVFEPGRGLIADSGFFITRITDVKSLRGRNYAAVDGSVAIFPRPLHHPKEYHRVIAMREPETEELNETYLVVGKTTFSRDILANTQLNARITTGDLLAFCDAGAYCRSMCSRFLGQDEPSVFITD